MSLIIKLLLVAAAHLAFYAGYPDTGPYGNYVLIISLLVCGGFMLFISIPVSIFKLFFSGTLGFVLNLAIFLFMCGAIAYTMPQRDNTRVLDKIKKGSYPDAAAFRAGLKRFGIAPEKQIQQGAKELEKRARKAAKKI